MAPSHQEGESTPHLEKFERHLDTIGIDPETIVVDERGTLTIDTGLLIPASLAELPNIAIDEGARPPQTAPELRIEDQLGQGGMGVVYSATQIPLRRRVAVKVPRKEDAGPLESGLLLREALITGTLEHPNIVPVHALGRGPDGRPMLVMKQIEGTPWRRSMRPLFSADEPLHSDEIEEELRTLIQVCRAVEFAHSRGIIHRDIKPDNVMIGAFGEVYLLDWGLAVSLAAGTGLPHLAQVRGLAGTPGYMAPEMARGDETIDERADLYQLGAVLHELITGNRRNAGESVVERLAAADMAVPHAYEEHVPPELAAICNRATARDPDERYADVGAFREAVAAFIHRRGSLQLVEEAFKRLYAYEDALAGDDLKTTLGNSRVHNLATEARFGFRLVLREWPDNHRAREGLQRLLERMIEVGLLRESPAEVATLLAELPQERPRLVERLEALNQRLRQRRAEMRRLEKMRDDADLGVVAQQRLVITLILGAVLAVPVLGLFVLRLLGVHVAGYPDAIGIMVIFVLAVIAGRVRLRSIGANRANLDLMDSIAAGCLGAVALFVTGMLGEVPLSSTLAATMVIGAASSAVMAVQVERRLLLNAPAFVTAGFLVTLWPTYQGLWIAVASGFAFFYSGWVWRRWVRDEAHRRQGTSSSDE